MKLVILLVIFAFTLPASQAAQVDESFWISLDEVALGLLQQKYPKLETLPRHQDRSAAEADVDPKQDRIYLARVTASQRDDLIRMVHDQLHHCAGFFAFDSLSEAMQWLDAPTHLGTQTRPDYGIDYQSVVAPMLATMSAVHIGNTIVSLSSFQNRYYNGSHGAQAADWLADTWLAMAVSRPDVSVEKVNRGSDAMPSVVLTIEGAELADQVVVVGAHLDSVNVVDRGGASHANSIAPGADDDASGVAGLTEIFRQLMASGFRPQRTIQLMAYSGEEFGLYGSRFIAADYAGREVDVVGVLQLDMTNYKGSQSDIYLIDDYTDLLQNQFLVDLLDAYLPTLTVAYSRCGYACSDHASWHLNGYVASFPFEAQFGDDNPYIHSSGDTFANSGEQAAHALKFSRLGLAYVVELGEVSGEQIHRDGFESVVAAGLDKKF